MRQYILPILAFVAVATLAVVCWPGKKDNRRAAFTFLYPVVRKTNTMLRVMIEQDPALTAKVDRFIAAKPYMQKLKKEFIQHQTRESLTSKSSLVTWMRHRNSLPPSGQKKKVPVAIK